MSEFGLPIHASIIVSRRASAKVDNLGLKWTVNCGTAIACMVVSGLAIGDEVEMRILLASMIFAAFVSPKNADAQTAWPTTATAGIPAGTTLKNCGGAATLATSNQIIDSCTYTGDITVTGSNVTIQKSRIYGQVWTSGNGSFTLTDSEIGPTSGCNGSNALGFENYTARRIYVHNFGDGVRVSGDNVTFTDSLLVNCSNPGDHADGVQGYQGGNTITINHNTIDLRAAAPDVTSPIFFADGSTSCNCTNNLLMGGGYSLRIHDDATPDKGPWVITGNRIVNGAWIYGPVLTTNTNCATTNWSDNRLVTIDGNYNVLTTGVIVNCDGTTSPAPTGTAPSAPTNLRIKT